MHKSSTPLRDVLMRMAMMCTMNGVIRDLNSTAPKKVVWTRAIRQGIKPPVKSFMASRLSYEDAPPPMCAV